MKIDVSIAAVLILCLISSPALSKETEDPNATAVRFGPPAETDWKILPEMTDEFDGDTLDTSKWHDHNPEWLGRQPGLFSPANIRVHDGQLHLTTRSENRYDFPEGYHTFTTAAVKSKTAVLYGYFEIKARPMQSRASSAFWFYHNTPALWTEIDVFEVCGADPFQNKYHMNAHVFHTPTDPNHWATPEVWQAPFAFTEGFHVYALQWDPKQLRWFVDGHVVRTLKNTHWHQPLYLNFDSETMPEWFGLPEKDLLPSIFSIDYVRAWQQLDKSPPAKQTNDR